MARLKQQFKDALIAVELGGDTFNAPKAHRLVLGALAAFAPMRSPGSRNPVPSEEILDA
ncbi:hypothetical protein [Mycolicibacterium sediminis]|uniref:Uncharacterized protein n=1 Tax=Mycolicibacterium sediminis TaxID=1286180 RepID=A0A7I7QUC7_9MYCO|nr:hypothetical protein [Mycolicibacterium sediminis]BBY29943.1 hypothetical protein MSEDJ_40390 [Mycolicibacterium sediminis]